MENTLEIFKEGIMKNAATSYGNNRMLQPEKFYETVKKAKDMTDLVIDLSWRTYKWEDETEDMQAVTDKEFECLVQYNSDNNMFELVRNLWSPINDFPKSMESFIEELNNGKYYVIGAWKNTTDFLGHFPW